MGPCIDVYSLSERRDRESIDHFLATYANLDGGLLVGDEISVLPIDFDGSPDELPLDRWESTPFADIEDLLLLGLSSPPRAFSIYLRARDPWCGAILCFARTGEITFGVSVDDPLNTDGPLIVARDLLVTLCGETDGSHGWAAHEMPPSVDPQRDRPWEASWNSAMYVPPESA